MDIYDLSLRIARYKERIENLEKSRSWRYTKLFRYVASKIRAFQSGRPNFKIIDNVLDSELNSNLQANRHMLSSTIKFIIFTHELSRTGAPIVVLELVKNLDYSPNEVLVISPKNGILLSEFQKYATVYIYENDVEDLRTLVQSNYDIFSNNRIILNTLCLSDVAKVLKFENILYLTWAHELRSTWDIIGIKQIEFQLQNSQLIICDSKVLVTQINEYFKNELNCIYIDNGFSGELNLIDTEIRKNLGVSENDFIVLILGTRQIRKGYDLFPSLVQTMFSKTGSEGVKFIWMGDTHDTELNTYVKAELCDFLSSNKVLILENSPYYLDLLHTSNVLVSLSREDSAPQVLAAAQNLSIPVLRLNTSFKNKDKIYNRQESLINLVSNLQNIIDNECIQSKSIISKINTWPIFIKNYELALESFQSINLSSNFVSSNSTLISSKRSKVDVTLIIIFYNQQDFVYERLNSIYQQTVLPNEIIIIEDFSSDSTFDFISRFTQENDFENVTVIQNSYNVGIPTLNWLEGVKKSRNKYVWIIEGDDLSDPEFLNVSYNSMVSNKVDIVVTGNYIFNDNMNMNLENKNLCDDSSLTIFPILYSYLKSYGCLAIDSIRTFGLNLGNPFYNIGQILWSRKVVLEALQKSSHELKLFCDLEVYLNVEKKAKLQYVPQNLNYFRSHINTIRSKTKLESYFLESMKIFETYLEMDLEVNASNRTQYLVNNLHLFSSNDQIYNQLISKIKESSNSNFKKRVLYLNYFTGNHYRYGDAVNYIIESVSSHFDLITLRDSHHLTSSQIKELIEILNPTFIIEDSSKFFNSLIDFTGHIRIIDNDFFSDKNNKIGESESIIFLGHPDDLIQTRWPYNRVFFFPREPQFENFEIISKNLFEYIIGGQKFHKQY
jgi:glycosyltransferase involved in cell wall biosynthesis